MSIASLFQCCQFFFMKNIYFIHLSPTKLTQVITKEFRESEHKRRKRDIECQEKASARGKDSEKQIKKDCL